MTKKNSPKMTKKSSSKLPLKKSHEGPSIMKKKPSFKPKKMGSEIDEIFAAKKRKSHENDDKKAPANEKPLKVSSGKVKSNGKMRMGRDEGKKSRSFNESACTEPISRSRKRTADGLTLYTEEELGFGKSDAGGTPLCPFDCDCCF